MISHKNLLNWEGNGWIDVDFNDLSISDLTELEAFISDEMTDIKNQLDRYDSARRTRSSVNASNPQMYNEDWYIKASTAYKRRATKLRLLQQVRRQKRVDYGRSVTENFYAEFFRVASNTLQEDVFEGIKEKANAVKFSEAEKG